MESATPPAAGTQDAPGGQPGTAAQGPSLEQQLFRYAQDLQQTLEGQSRMESEYETLAHSHRRLAAYRDAIDRLVHSRSDIYVVTNARGTILHANPAMARMSSASLVGYNLADWVLPAYQRACLDLLAATLAGDGAPSAEQELKLHRETPQSGPLVVMATALRVAREARRHDVHWLLRDVTAQRASELKAQMSALVFHSTREGVLITDSDAKILSVNPAFSRITGYSAEEVVGRNPRMLKSGRHDRAFYQKFWESLLEQGSWQGEMHNRAKNGDIFCLAQTVTAARGSDGEILSYISVFSDMTQLVQANRRLYNLARALSPSPSP